MFTSPASEPSRTTDTGSTEPAAAGSVATIESEVLVELTSVGIDIGSATSHLVISRLVLEKVGSRYITVDRTVIYQAPVILTPYANSIAIDGDRLGAYVREQYAAAGLSRHDIDTGALVLTGIALTKHNARPIADLFAYNSGELVAVSAGDRLEANMAARGSGATRVAREQNRRLLHVDIGGGTTKLALCTNGGVVASAAMDVGARILTTDVHQRVTNVEEPAARVAHHLGIEVIRGSRLNPNDRAQLVGYLADEVIACATSKFGGTLSLWRGTPLRPVGPIDGLTFSGGVAEYLYGREQRQFGDLGQDLAKALIQRASAARLPIIPMATGIRATVLGASQYTAQVSGSTVHVSPGILPLRNVPVIAPSFTLDSQADSRSIARSLTESLNAHDLLNEPGPVAIAYSWSELATYERLRAFAAGIRDGIAQCRDQTSAVVLVCEDDVGSLIGHELGDRTDWARPLVSIDCIALNNFDYIDIGEPLPRTSVIPIVIKTLQFPE